MKDNRLYGFMVKGENADEDDCGELYVIDMTDVLRKQATFWGNDDAMFCPEPMPPCKELLPQL